MSVKIRLPSAISPENEIELDVETCTIEELFDMLSEKIGQDLKRKLVKNGELSPFINVFVNGENIRYLDGLRTVIRKGDEVSVVPAVAGG